MALDLQRLAADTRVMLDTCWSDLGIAAEERSTLLQGLVDDVAAIYRSRVEAQEARRREKAEQVESMQALIQGMQRAMEESDAEVKQKKETPAADPLDEGPSPLLQIPRNGMTLIEFATALEAKRHALQEVR